MSEPRKHHYLPQFYLRRFSADGRALYQIEKSTGRYYPVQVKDVAAVRDYHELDGDDRPDPNALEKELARLEAEQAEHLSDVLTYGIGNPVSRANIVAFLAITRMRVPAVKSHVERTLEATHRANLRLLERSGKLPKPPKGYEKALAVDNLEIEVYNWKILDVMYRMGTSQKHLDALAQMRHTLYRAPAGMAFITCDQPVAIFHPSPHQSRDGVGPATENAQVTLPLSSGALLLLDHSDQPHVERIATPDEVNEFNRRTIIMAQDYVYVGAEPHKVVPQVHACRKSAAGFDFETIYDARGFGLVMSCRPVGPSSAQ